MNKAELENLLVKEFNLTPVMLGQLSKYAEILEKESKLLNLTTITDLEGIYIKHFYDSLLLTKCLNQTIDSEKTLLDVGTGAGFPGIVLKIAMPNLKVTLLEPTSKKCTFLSKVINELELKDIRIVNNRAESYIQNNRESYDYVTARAVAPLNILLELTTPFLKKNGEFFAMKGANYESEVSLCDNAIKLLNIKEEQKLEFSFEPYFDKRVIIVYEKILPTPKKYPRIYGTIKKNPL